MQVALFISLSCISPEPPSSLSPSPLALSPPVCCFSLLICHIAEVSPLSPDLFMIRLLISFTMTLESASQIKILQAKCVPCTVHGMCVCVCVCLSGKKKEKENVLYLQWFIRHGESRCLNNPLSDYMRASHAYAKLQYYMFCHKYHSTLCL